jgi:pimeloyl-ACP methyl ester carboxylesterase
LAPFHLYLSGFHCLFSVLFILMSAALDLQYAIYEHWLEGRHGVTRYWESSPQQGVPIVLVHGYGALIEHWWRVMRPLAQVHTVYALDLYGFGYSSRLRRSPSKELWADQVADLVCKVLPSPAIVVGHSMGGVVAAQVAYNYPEFVRGLVLVDSTGLRESGEPTTFIERLLMGAIRTPLVGEMMSGVLSGRESVRQSLLAAYYRKNMVTPALVEAFLRPLQQPGSVQSYLAVSRAFERLLLDMEPGAVQSPTLIVWGAEDRSPPPSHASLLKQRVFPDAELRLMAGAGHCPFDELPEDFCEVLLSWIGQS